MKPSIIASRILKRSAFYKQAKLRRPTMDCDTEATSSERIRRPEDTFRILVATDLHLGYKEHDQIRGNDTLEAFREVMMTARQRDVDFVLLGTDDLPFSIKGSIYDCKLT